MLRAFIFKLISLRAARPPLHVGNGKRCLQNAVRDPGEPCALVAARALIVGGSRRQKGQRATVIYPGPRAEPNLRKWLLSERSRFLNQMGKRPRTAVDFAQRGKHRSHALQTQTSDFQVPASTTQGCVQELRACNLDSSIFRVTLIFRVLYQPK